MAGLGYVKARFLYNKSNSSFYLMLVRLAQNLLNAHQKIKVFFYEKIRQNNHESLKDRGTYTFSVIYGPNSLD